MRIRVSFAYMNLYLQLSNLRRLSSNGLFHHFPRLSGSFREVMTQLLRPTFQARDGPANVVVSDGIREAVTIGNDLTVTPTIYEFRRKLRGGQLPVAGLVEGLVGVDLWDFFARGEHLLETEQVVVDTLTIASPGRVLDMSSGGPPEERSAVHILLKRCENVMSPFTRYNAHGIIGVQHGLGPCLTLVASTPDDLGPSGLVLPGLGTLIANPWPPEHFMEGELFHQLDPSVRR